MNQNIIEINKRKYNYKLFDTNELIELLRHNKTFIKSLEDTIKIYRNDNKFIITHLISEYIISDPNSMTKYSVIYKKNVIVSTSRIIYNKKSGYINLVYVNPEYRGQKICQNHIQHLIKLTNLTKYELHVLKDNISALKCYENIGFKKIKDVEHNTYLMRLKIKNL
jgi:ribosomal protein S18 acetylase RimI-like enzyme